MLKKGMSIEHVSEMTELPIDEITKLFSSLNQKVDPTKKIAINMLKKGLTVDEVYEMTELTREEIENLQLSLDTTVNLEKDQDSVPDKPTEPSGPPLNVEDKYIGKEVSGYKIERRIGKGGMGIVYYAKNQLGDEAVVSW